MGLKSRVRQLHGGSRLKPERQPQAGRWGGWRVGLAGVGGLWEASAQALGLLALSGEWFQAACSPCSQARVRMDSPLRFVTGQRRWPEPVPLPFCPSFSHLLPPQQSSLTGARDLQCKTAGGPRQVFHLWLLFVRPRNADKLPYGQWGISSWPLLRFLPSSLGDPWEGKEKGDSKTLVDSSGPGGASPSAPECVLKTRGQQMPSAWKMAGGPLQLAEPLCPRPLDAACEADRRRQAGPLNWLQLFCKDDQSGGHHSTTVWRTGSPCPFTSNPLQTCPFVNCSEIAGVVSHSCTIE